ncbi:MULTISPECIES: hypothetical protein [Trichocoleus]|nr:hypothetical protein [Trichocoleus sp. FACHB-46]
MSRNVMTEVTTNRHYAESDDKQSSGTLHRSQLDSASAREI